MIVGDGPDRSALESMARELGIEERVHFRGTVGRDDVLRLFRASDAALLSSAWENFPHAVVEALAVGCPVVATRVGGIPEVVRDGENGLLVPPLDTDGLASAISRLADDSGLRARVAAAAAASVASHTEQAVFSAIEAELEKAARG